MKKMMNKGKISFGKIGFSLMKKDEESNKIQNEKNETSNEQTVGGFGSFSKLEISPDPKSKPKENVSSIMGFEGFGKKAKEFDLEKMVADSRRYAAEKKKAKQEIMTKVEDKEQVNEDDEGEDSSEEFIGPPLPQSLDNEHASADEDEDEFVGPPLPPGMVRSKEDEKEEEDEEDDEEETYKLPITHELELDHGNRTVSALSVDPAGARLVTGGVDYEVKYWDFQGMDASKQAFRSFKPADGYPINNIEYSITGDKVLVIAGSQQAKVYDRDGIELFECVKGDMYLHDMAKTKGHIAGLTNGSWHTKDKEEFMTTGRDGTCRLWHIESPHQQRHVIKPRAKNGLKTIPTACTYNRDGLLIACACDDGSVQMWDHRKNYVNVALSFRAHDRGSETSSITFSYDNKLFATRGGDDTLKLWDVRNSKSAVHVANELFNRFSMTDCLFSPNDQLVITGTSLNRGETTGKLYMYDRNTWEIVHEMEVGPSHVVRVVWHPRLNQLMVGCGDGNVRLLYDPQLSHNGAVLVAAKRRKRAKQTEVVVSQQIITPHALPMFREDRHKSTRKLEERDRKDPVRSQRPDLPITGAGSGGRVAAGGSTLSSYIIRNMGIRNKLNDEEDPREALLKFAKDAAENPYWVTPAYSKTQPSVIFQDQGKANSEEEEQEEEEEHVVKKQKT
ncbi:WD repeat-containing protein 70-like isoform X2 [Oratosquilla oratoria]|uniref:WD repeat-containing protein 70-like isoform X2 n=1 Tax=Oratosquilla oratoria TaxID=337810 RepID=UPI003F767841